MERLPYLATVGAAAYERLRPLPVVVLLENIRSLYNVGAFFRTADSACIQRLLLTGITGYPPSSGIAKTALGAENTVTWEHHADPTQLIADLRQGGYEIAAVETSVHSVDLFDWRPSFPVCILFGNEVDGISSHVLDACDLHVRIPSLGVKHSLNVASAGAVVIYELLRKYRALMES